MDEVGRMPRIKCDVAPCDNRDVRAFGASWFTGEWTYRCPDHTTMFWVEHMMNVTFLTDDPR